MPCLLTKCPKGQGSLMILINFLKHRCCGSMEVRVMPGAGPGFRTASPRALPRDNNLQLLKRGPPDPHLGENLNKRRSDGICLIKGFCIKQLLQGRLDKSLS